MGTNGKPVSSVSTNDTGKTLWEMFIERITVMFGKQPPKPVEKPLELQYYNPLEAKIGQTIQFEAEPDLVGIDFRIESIFAYGTVVGGKTFYHTDYILRGLSLNKDKAIQLRLRLIDDDQSTDPLRCKFQLLHVFQEQEYSQALYDLCMKNGDHDETDEPGENTFKVNYSEDGTELETPQRFWRCEGVPKPYSANVATLDKVGDQMRKSHLEVMYWDFSRITNDDGDQEVLEYLAVEMDITPDPTDQVNPSRYMTILRGPELKSFQVQVT